MKLSLMTLNLFFTIFYRFMMTQDMEEYHENYEEMLDLVKESGFEAVDMTNMEVQTLGLPYVKEQLAKRDLKVSSLICMGDFAQVDESKSGEIISQGKQAADWCVELGAKVQMLVPSTREDLSRFSEEEIHQALVRHFTPVAVYAREKGIRPVIEDAPQLQYHMCTAAQLRKLLGCVPELELVYDSGNMVLVKEDPVEYLKQFADQLGHVHLKDMRPATDADRGADVGIDGVAMTGAASGTGCVDLKAVTGTLKEIGYDGYCTVEFAIYEEREYFSGLVRSRDYCEKLI